MVCLDLKMIGSPPPHSDRLPYYGLQEMARLQRLQVQRKVSLLPFCLFFLIFKPVKPNRKVLLSHQTGQGIKILLCVGSCNSAELVRRGNGRMMKLGAFNELGKILGKTTLVTSGINIKFMRRI